MDRYLIVSTDGHAGLPMAEYRSYVDSKYHKAFDEALPRQKAMTRIAEEKFLIPISMMSGVRGLPMN